MLCAYAATAAAVAAVWTGSGCGGGCICGWGSGRGSGSAFGSGMASVFFSCWIGSGSCVKFCGGCSGIIPLALARAADAALAAFSAKVST